MKIAALIKEYSREQKDDRFLRLLERNYPWLHALIAVFLALGGSWYGWHVESTPVSCAYYATSFVGIGFFTRMIVVLNVTWCVNSICHMWGYRNYDTDDDSTNNWVIGWIGFGEGWHNNHHRLPGLAMHGHKWWEFDPSYRLICFLRLIRLAWDVKDRLPASFRSG